MTDQDNIIDHLSLLFRDAESGLNGMTGSAMHQFQRKSFESLKRVRFPDKKHEDWRYTSVQKLMAPKYKLADQQPAFSVPDIPDMDSYVITFINGKVNMSSMDPRLSATGVRIIPLQHAFENETWKKIFGEYLAGVLPNSNRAFELLNFTFHANGFFLSVPKNTVLTIPIEIRFIHDDTELSFSHPLYFIHSESGSQIEVIERFERNAEGNMSSDEGLINSIGYIHVEKNAIVRHIKWQELGPAQHLVYKLFVRQLRDSRFETFAFDHGGQLTRNNVEIELEDLNTYSSLHAGFLASRQQSMDHQTRINHKAPHCESHEHYKGIIDDQSSAAFNGKVLVHKDAQKTNAFQQNDTLVLSKFALMNSKPQLEIFADDVKCSHGATIGQLDEKALFYLKSRGLPFETAKHMLKKAFIAEVLDKVPNDKMRHYISSQMGINE